MKTYADCIPCFFKQAQEASRHAGLGEEKKNRVFRELARALEEFDNSTPPPVMGKRIHEMVKRISGKKDPYRDVKRRSNESVLEILPHLQKKVARSRDRLALATELAIAGNIIDYGAQISVELEKDVRDILERERGLTAGEGTRLFHIKRFLDGLSRARNILYLADNAGEIVFDRILIDEILRHDGDKEITLAVRERPIINDVVKADVRQAGLDPRVRVISSGSDAPGTALALCNARFMELFNSADMVISKGQGNFECLSDVSREVFFLFMTKCMVVARHMKCPKGEIVLIRKGTTR